MFIVGIDEVGKGPLAGPVAVGVVIFDTKNEKNLKKFLKDVKDSKKLTGTKREEIFQKIEQLNKLKGFHILRYIVRYASNKVIDKKGINWAIKSCIDKSFKKLQEELSLNSNNTKILLDGGLKAPSYFKNQKTIIRGDDKEFSISLASIIAKVERDNFMKKMDIKYPGYYFHINKGYGTKKHMEMINKKGLSPIHRKTWVVSQ